MDSAKETVFKMFESVQKGTEYVLQAVPSDKLDYQINENSAQLGDLAFHIAAMPLASVLFGDGTFEQFPAPEKLIEELAKHLGDAMSDKDYLAIFKSSCEIFLKFHGEKNWSEDKYSSFLHREPVSHLQAFLGTQNHLVQHRGTLTTYLRSLDIPVTLKQYWGYAPL
ncbi:MAG: hypothetical protein ACXAB7_14810 [Candidatus Kariarchaeaceae archaeon]|jgi:uncharacterized damage-inducible protein DinB